MSRKPVTRALRLSFIWSFVVSVGAFVGLITVGTATAANSGITAIEGLLLLVMVAAGSVWYVSLGMLAHRLGRRWLVWVGLSFIFSPIAPLITFPLMLGYTRAAAQEGAVAPVPGDE